MTQRGGLLTEVGIVLLVAGIALAVVLPRAVDFWRVARVENEATQLASDLRHLQEQSRTNDFRAVGLADFYELSANLTMNFNKNGWSVQRSVTDVVYRHRLPDGVKLNMYNNHSTTATVSINFGHNGGSVRNNTFQFCDAANPALCRYVIVSGAGRVRVSSSPPTGDY